MAIASPDRPQRRGRASLIGGIAVGSTVAAMWWLLARDLAPAQSWATLPGIPLGVAIAAWIRAADL